MRGLGTTTENYYKLMLGKGSIHANDCFSEEVVGTDFELAEDLTDKLPEAWRDFNKTFIPIFIQNEPDKSKVSASLACGALWTVSKDMKDGDILLLPDGQGRYSVGEIIGAISIVRVNFSHIEGRSNGVLIISPAVK